MLGRKDFCQIEKSARGGKSKLVTYQGVLINYSFSSPAYGVWDFKKHKAYDVAALAFDEAADLGWWRPPIAVLREEEGPLFFSKILASLVLEPIATSEVIDGTLQTTRPAATTPRHRLLQQLQQLGQQLLQP